jgi:threonine dehydrogenase-like Zn-dependent dehydrogenase
MPEALYVVAPGEIEIRPESSGHIGPDEARVRMLHSGISHGTEMNVYSGRNVRQMPCRIGYCAVGEVVECGPQFTKASVGDHVFGYASHATEFRISQQRPVFKLPEGLDARCGVFTALGGVAYNGVLESQVALGETAVVFGLGAVGLCTTFLLRRAGAFRVISVDPIGIRQEAGLRMGACAALDPGDELADRVSALNEGELADVVLETSGAIQGLNDALKVIRKQSTIVALSWYSRDAAGLDLTRDFHVKRPNIKVAQGDSTPLHLSSRWTEERRALSTLQLLPEMPLNTLISHSFPFSDAQKAYELVHDHPEQCIQVVLEY